MNRRDFLKSAALLTAAGAMLGKGSVLKATETPAVKPAKTSLNFNPQMQYRPMGRTGVNVSVLGFGLPNGIGKEEFAVNKRCIIPVTVEYLPYTFAVKRLGIAADIYIREQLGYLYGEKVVVLLFFEEYLFVHYIR